MKLKGKRIERLNQFGDALILKLQDGGTMRLSPGLMSKLKLDKDNNKIGFGYPENEDESLVIYKAIDGNGIAVNKQGYIKNIPHNRDLRNHLDLVVDSEIEINISESTIKFDEYPGMVFHKISREEISNKERVQNTIDDLHQAVEKSGGEVITKETISDEEIEEISPTPITTEDTIETKEKKNDDEEVWFKLLI